MERTSPGEILMEEFLKPHKLTVQDLAKHTGVSAAFWQCVIDGRASLNAVLALKLSGCFGNSPEFWLNAQQTKDLQEAEELIDFIPGLIFQ